MTNHNIEMLIVHDGLDEGSLNINELSKDLTSFKIHLVNNINEAHEFVYCLGKYSTRKGNKNLKLILLEIEFPSMASIELLEVIKSDALTKILPLVIISSSNNKSNINSCYSLGANSYMIKPTQKENYLALIQEIASYWIFLNHPPIS